MAKVKIKTHKASAKRFSVTGTGKVKMHHSAHRHNLSTNKTQKQKRRLRSADILSPAMEANVKRLIMK
ncbi:MAG: 50S ribosomal protein L35 [Clostridia bacterium]|nr:50S ribosomal protein L35 [Clostridia bacterium]